MRRGLYAAVLIGMMGIGGIAAAHEAPGLAPDVQAIKEKYHGLKEQMRQEFKQKMQALEQQEHHEIEAAMSAAHEKRAETMQAKHEERVKHRDTKDQELKARKKDERSKKHHETPSGSPAPASH